MYVLEKEQLLEFSYLGRNARGQEVSSVRRQGLKEQRENRENNEYVAINIYTDQPEQGNGTEHRARLLTHSDEKARDSKYVWKERKKIPTQKQTHKSHFDRIHPGLLSGPSGGHGVFLRICQLNRPKPPTATFNQLL